MQTKTEMNFPAGSFQSRGKYSDLPKRMRFYQGTLDVDSLTHSQNYELLRETWIIFICDFDMFGLEEPAYKVRMSLDSLEDSLLSEKYEDGTHKIFLNLNACDKIKDEKLRNFLKYLKTKQPQDSFTEKIERSVDFNRRNAQWRKDYMTVAQEIEYEKAQERKIAFAKGHTAGLAEGRTSAYAELVRKGIISVSQAAEQLGISEDDVRKMTE